MCIAIFKPGDKTLSKELLSVCFENNNDGAGFAYINVDSQGIKRIKIKKSMTFDGFWSKYERATRISPNSPFIIHFRIATHGTVDLFNCHPFKINEDLVFAHNGIISKVKKDAKKSDTQVFNETILKKLGKGLLFDNPVVQELIEDYIGGSKLILMDVNGAFRIFNEKSGNTQDGVWFSNYSWKAKVTYTPKTYTGNYYGDYDSYGRTSNQSLLPKPQEKLPKRPQYDISLNSYVACDCCGVYHQVSRMSHFFTEGEEVSLCNNCNKKQGLAALGILEFDHIMPEHFVALVNSGDTVMAC